MVVSHFQPRTPMSDPASKAVFLSYAREDASAVRRIADALQAFGVEVWFDQSELRGGDAWDARLRREGRGQGSRVEWKNALSPLSPWPPVRGIGGSAELR